MFVLTAKNHSLSVYFFICKSTLLVAARRQNKQIQQLAIANMSADPDRDHTCCFLFTWDVTTSRMQRAFTDLVTEKEKKYFDKNSS